MTHVEQLAFTPSQAAAAASVSRPTIYRWIEQGILPKPHKLGATRNFWTVGEIRDALKNGSAA